MARRINGRMLGLARDARHYSQTKLAKAIGVSQSKLSKVLNEEQELSEKAFIKLCKVLDFPASFFYQPTPTSPVSHYYYRKRVSIGAKALLQMDGLVQIYKKNIDVFLESVELPGRAITCFDPFEDTPEEIARKTRFLLNIPRGPIKNLVKLLENQGIVVIATDLLHDKVDGICSVSDKGARIIFINSKMSHDRQRFSLAHEYGHMIMHMDTIPSTNSDVEKEANRFASELLMPELEIKSQLRGITLPKLADLKRHWKVSMKALLYRAHVLGTITDRQWRQFQMRFSQKGINKVEPVALPEEAPFLMKEIIDLYISELGYSYENLAKLSHLNWKDFEDRFVYTTRPKLKVLKQIGY